MIILKYLKFEVYYIFIDEEFDIKKNKIATKLKKNNIVPLPIEFQKKISSRESVCLSTSDPDEIAYKRNIELAPDSILKNFCSLFSINENEKKKIRLLLQDFISKHQSYTSPLATWSALYPQKRLIYVSFKFKDFYNARRAKNIFKIVVPLDILKYLRRFFGEIISVFFSIFTIIYKKKQNSKILNERDLNEISKKTVALIPHRGIIYGTNSHNIFEKTLYYSEDINSNLNKYNILHLDYSNYTKPEQNMHWIALNKMQFSRIKIFLKTIMGMIKTFYLIRGWNTFLGWLFFIQKYNMYIKYCDIIKKFTNLKIAIIDYEVLCPKSLILALENNNIKTIATQERFIHTFFSSFSNVILDTYYVSSEFAARIIKNSKYHDVKNIIPAGQYRSDYISEYKKKNIPDEISKAKADGKKIIVFLGHHSTKNWFESNKETIVSWSAQVSFLEDVIKLSKQLKNTFIVIRYKYVEWRSNSYFKDILDRVDSCENIIISNYYKEPFHSYKLCANADLIIAKHTSIADESLSKEIPLLFYEYTHNMKNIVTDAFDYFSSEIMCYNFEELLNKSKSILFDNPSKLKEEISKLGKKIYHVEDKSNIKNKIIRSIENTIQSA